MTTFLLQNYAFAFSVNFHNEKSRCTPLSGFLFVRRQVLLSPSYFSLSPCKFSLSYKIFFVTNFVTRITKFVTCVRKFVTAVTKFVINFFCQIVKIIKEEGKNCSVSVNFLRYESRGVLQNATTCLLSHKKRQMIEADWNVVQTRANDWGGL